MVILDFIKRASARDLRSMALLTLAAGFANALLVVIVNDVAGLVANAERPSAMEWVIFACAFLVYYQCNKLALLRANRVIEKLLKDLRVRITEKLRASELPVVDRMGRSHLYGLISRETNHLSVTFPLLVDSFQQSVLLLVSLVYLAYLSPLALFVFIGAVGIGILGYRRINEDFRETLRAGFGHQARMLDATSDIIDGFKELRLNTRRSDAAMTAYRTASASAEEAAVRSGEHWASLILLSSFVTYLMLGVVGFVLPQYMTAHGAVVFQLIPTLLFCMGPLAKIVAQSPMFLQAEVGLKAIAEIEQQLDSGDSVSTSEARSASGAYAGFREITYRGLTFSYGRPGDSSRFHVGPLNLTVRSGETLFLVGGNGSGKSTTLRLLTGLYPAEEGVVEINGVPLRERGAAGLRELFSAVFADFHLFDRLYGAEHADPAEVQRLIGEMGLAHKVKFENGRFSQTNLSTGQRKRLALISALLEDRPIYVFDEWSAEQDVHFRRHFYTKILADLKARGKTIIAVTHDERYWSVADRVVRLDLGSVLWDRPGAAWSGA
ncbi:cyclic peptide export ABC transporter [Hyphomicrobium sp.]|uniref:cyclic peptide export ABC transporter n=1 Tax=Hyphomicrobium sp. TaxID=82 RepID=UPI002E35D8D7|nr:cyclic peptide export ABC transporter [Hyphomicrobium sp.]HEX2841887.1 cyclic peptide export ABC transporter [Hyphomicrobium sp.]